VPSTGFLSVDKTTDYIVAQVDFRGSAEEWQQYCRRIVQIWGLGKPLRSIYLQRVDMEFEVADERVPGRLVATNGPSKDEKAGGAAQLPPYKA
jgi:hypothetical protein